MEAFPLLVTSSGTSAVMAPFLNILLPFAPGLIPISKQFSKSGTGGYLLVNANSFQTLPPKHFGYLKEHFAVLD